MTAMKRTGVLVAALIGMGGAINRASTYISRVFLRLSQRQTPWSGVLSLRSVSQAWRDVPHGVEPPDWWRLEVPTPSRRTAGASVGS